MAISLHAVTPEFVAEVGDIDLGKPISASEIGRAHV